MPLVDQTADHLAGEGGSFEPQRTNNFSLEIARLGDDKDLIILALDAFTLPKMSNEKITLQYQNGEVYVAGRMKTEGGSLVVKDFVDRDILGACLRWRRLVSNNINGSVGLAKSYKMVGNLILMSPDGSTTLERVCKLSGLWPPEDPSFSELSMGGNEIVKLSMPLSCDKVDWSATIVFPT